MSHSSFLRLCVAASMTCASLLSFQTRAQTVASASATQHRVTQVQRFAVMVGANEGGQQRATLRYASKDASTLEKVLSGIGGVAPEHRITLHQPTPQKVQKALEEISAKVQAQRSQASHRAKRFELVFYYSGHSDEQGLLIGEQSVKYKELKRWISQVPTDVHVAILDSCASGAFTRQKGGAHRKPFLFANSGNVKGHAFIASSSADEASQESDKIAGSFFTHYLVSGLRGAADFDGDQLVTINEAFLFARNETLARTQSTQAGAQHPAYELKLAGTGDLVLTDLRRSRSSLELASELRGRVYLRDQNQRLVSELLKVKGKILLAVTAGTYEVMLDDGDKLSRAQVDVSGRGVTTLSSADFKPIAREAISATRGSLQTQTAPAPFLGAAWALVPGIEYPKHAPHQERNARFAAGLLHHRLHRLHGFSTGLGVSTTLVETKGWQGAVTGNVARGRVYGVQGSLGFNASATTHRGVQLSGITNISRMLRGLQLTGLLNIGQDISGGQVALGINYAQRVRGAQVGLLNIANRSRGLQLGLINIAKSSDVSIGLIPYTKGGIHLDVFSSDLALLNLAMRFEAKYNYSFLTVGMHPTTQGKVWLGGAGLGAKIPVGTRFSMTPDLVFRFALGGNLDSKTQAEDRLMAIGSLRFLFNVQLLPRLGLFGGPAWHLRYVASSNFDQTHQRPGLPLPSFAMDAKGHFRHWFGFVAGIKI